MKEISSSERQTRPIFGIKPIVEAIEAGKDIEKILILKGAHGEGIRELSQLCRKRDIPLKQVPVERLNRVTRNNHQGAIAYMAPVSYQNLKDVLLELNEKKVIPLFIMLDRVTDVRNFGAIARSAECAGAHAIIIGKQGSAPLNADAVKTSAGALMRIPVCREQNLKTTLQFLRDEGLQSIACTEKTSETIYSPDYKKPSVIIMGSEEDGISDPLLKSADYLASIPMNGTIGSLNVSVASGIILFEALRQRQA